MTIDMLNAYFGVGRFCPLLFICHDSRHQATEQHMVPTWEAYGTEHYIGCGPALKKAEVNKYQ